MDQTISEQARLVRAVDERREELIELTQDLVRIPTINPPGECYLEICEYLVNRLKSKGFETELIRAKGAFGDSGQISPLERDCAHRRTTPR